MIEIEEVEEVYRRLSQAMPGRTKDAKGPKGQPDAFRSCISCMLSAQSLDLNTAAATKALFALATTPEGLLALPGIGRKCADIVLSFTFGKDVIAVDAHVHRVCNRIGLTEAKTADKTAQQLEERSPDWAMRDGHFWLIQFGKRVCRARAPQCGTCPVNDLCEYYAGNGEETQ